MPIKGLNQVALPQAKAILERLKFNVVSAARMWAHVSSVPLCFLLTPTFANILHVCMVEHWLWQQSFSLCRKDNVFFVLVFQWERKVQKIQHNYTGLPKKISHSTESIESQFRRIRQWEILKKLPAVCWRSSTHISPICCVFTIRLLQYGCN